MKDAGLGERIGLCARCRHARSSANRRGSEFWRCAAADHDRTLLRYPPLPVRACRAFEAGDRER